jgi:hypothetical protein
MHLAAFALLLFAAAGDFTHDDDVDGISVESRSVTGSKFVELRFTATTTKTVESLCDAAFGNGKLDANSDAEVKSRKILEESADERVTYDQIQAPVVSDRDYAILAKRIREPNGTCRTTFVTANEKAPKLQDGWVRIDISGSWRFEPKDGKTLVTYTIFTDPGGSIPAWMIEGRRKKSGIENMKRLIARGKER